jgi:hypothetical protein
MANRKLQRHLEVAYVSHDIMFLWGNINSSEPHTLSSACIQKRW